MEESGVVPDVISEVPPEICTIKFGNLNLELGQQLTPSQVEYPPELSWTTEEGALYTLCETDPDIPTRQDNSEGEFQHWLVMNIPGTRLAEGDVVSKYIGALPPKGRGRHRYVFVVYKQPGRIDTEPEKKQAKNLIAYRRGFKLQKFAEKHNLGKPIASNFHQTEFQNYFNYIPIATRLLCRMYLGRSQL